MSKKQTGIVIAIITLVAAILFTLSARDTQASKIRAEHNKDAVMSIEERLELVQTLKREQAELNSGCNSSMEDYAIAIDTQVNAIKGKLQMMDFQ